MTSSYFHLLASLKGIAESAGEGSVVLISIGCRGSNSEQQIPSYLKNIAQDKEVTILLIDANFCTEKQLKILINQHELESKDSTDRVFKPRETLM